MSRCHLYLDRDCFLSGVWCLAEAGLYVIILQYTLRFASFLTLTQIQIHLHLSYLQSALIFRYTPPWIWMVY